MRKLLFIVSSLLFVSSLSYAQTPKGDRIFAWQIDMAENNDFDSAFYYCAEACMESSHFAFNWSSMEPDTAQYDPIFVASFLDILDIYFPAFNMPIELQIATINTVAKETPSELDAVNFSDPQMIRRFKIMIDTMFAHMPNVTLSALNIGNESDVFLGADMNAYNDYKIFLDSVIPYTKQAYFNIHGTDLKVGTTLTLSSLTNPVLGPLCQILNDDLDIISVTYYPLAPNFTMEAPSAVFADFQDIVNLYPDTATPIYFVECGYSSSDTCGSSEVMQAQFYENVFTAWDTHYDNIKYISAFKLTDWSQADVDTLSQYYGISDLCFLEYLRALGVRTWDGNGRNKLAYDQIKCDLAARGWCNVNCIATSVETSDNNIGISIFPNPADDFITIKSEEAIETVKIYNSSGKLVLVDKSNDVEISALTSGIYLVSIMSKSGKTSTKQIVIK